MDIGNDIRQAVTKYSDMLYRICIVILCNEQDVQDAIQDTFCRYLEKAPDFHDEEHEKAWLIRVTVNLCRDYNKSAWYKKVKGFDGNESEIPWEMEELSLWEELSQLKPVYRNIIYLYYYEGYKVHEIAGILNLRENTVSSHLTRARKKLRTILEREGRVYV